MLEQAISKIRAACLMQTPTDPCTSPRVIAVSRATVPQYDRRSHSIRVSAVSLRPEMRPLLAHELGHAWFSEARDCAGRVLECEELANWHAIALLVVGWGYDDATAYSMVWGMLWEATQRAVKPGDGHNPCAEIHDLEHRAHASTSTACQETE